MPTATATNQATGQANGQAEPAPSNGNGDHLTAAYWQALDRRNKKTGDIPATQLAAVKTAYSHTDPRKRTNLVKTLTLQAADRIVNDNGEVDQSVAIARKALSAILDEARAETNRNERPPHDPVPEVVAILAAIDAFRTDLVAKLDDNQRKALRNVKPSDDDATTAKTAVDKALDRIRDRALNGRSGYSGPRTPAADTAAAVRKAVHAADHPLTLTELAKAAGIEQSTAYSRHKANNTPGVKATTDGQGRSVFVKDTAA